VPVLPGAAKFESTSSVTLPPAGIFRLNPVKVADEPEKLVEDIWLAPLFKVMELIPVEAVPVPVSPIVRLVKVTFEGLGLFNTTWITGTLEVPGSTVVLAGVADAGAAEMVTWVGVLVGVKVAVIV